MNNGAVRSGYHALALAVLLSAGAGLHAAEPRLGDAPRLRAASEPGQALGGEGVGSDLGALFEQRAGGVLGRRTASSALAPRTIGNDLVADVVLHRDAPDLVERIEAAGGVVRAISGKHLRASVLVSDLDEASRIAALPEVRWVARDYGPFTRKGAVTSRAVRALNVTPIAGAPSNLTGAGQRVGILSDSFARTSDVVDGDTTTNGTAISPSGNARPVTLRRSRPQDSGDLPEEVELRRDDADATDLGPMADEGAAMGELIHDIAPGAALSFYTAFVSLPEFAAGVDDLCSTRGSGGAGATVVVDDVGYLDELMYQPDVLFQEAANCVNRGVPYFSAAGNTGDSGFRLDFVDFAPLDDDNDDTDGDSDGAPPGSADGDFHDWDPTGAGANTLQIDLDDGEEIVAVLQWNQPALSTPQNSSNGPRIDLDLYLSTTNNAANFFSNLLDSSFLDQRASTALAGMDPIEIIGHRNTTGGPQTVYLAVDHWAGSETNIPQDAGTPLEFRLVLFESGGNGAVYTPAPNGPTVYGHPMADGAVSVAAVPWWEAPSFDPEGQGPTSNIDPERFSARGGSIPLFFRADGTFAASASDEPDLAAVDGNNTTFFGQSSLGLPAVDSEPDSFPNFFGTSAAAPSAAAVAALLREDDCKQSPAQIESKLKNAAIDVTGNRAAVGDDDVTGAGLIDASAIPLAGGTATCNSGGGGGGGSTGWLVLIGLLVLLRHRHVS